MSTLAKLKKRLVAVEAKLEKIRPACANYHDNGLMRKARSERNWDYYAQLKFKLQSQIEELELKEFEDKTRSILFCNSCQAMFEAECCCNEI